MSIRFAGMMIGIVIGLLIGLFGTSCYRMTKEMNRPERENTELRNSGWTEKI